MKLLIGLVTPVLLVACGGGGGGGVENTAGVANPAPPAQNSPRVAAYLSDLTARGVVIPREVGEERALVVTDPATKEVITVRGNRGGNADLASVSQIESTVEGKTDVVTYVSQTSQRFAINNGVQVDLDREAGGGWVVKFFDPETSTSFQTNLPNGASAPPTTGGPSAGALKMATGAPVKLVAEKAASPNPAQIPVTIRTTNCGREADIAGPVQLVLRAGGMFLGNYSTTKTGVGVYEGFVPDIAKEHEISLNTVKSAIESASEVMSVACAADQASPLAGAQACAVISTSIASTVIGVPVAAKFAVACAAAVTASKLSCKVLGAIQLPVPEYIDAATAAIIPTLDGILVKVLPTTLLAGQVIPQVAALPTNITGAPIALNGTAALSGTIDRTVLTVGDILLSPSSPPAGVNYTASVALQCVDPGTAVLAVLGTDSFSNSTSRTYSTRVADDVLRLQVPGAQAGVRDTVTLTATPASGPPVTRTAFLVFK